MIDHHRSVAAVAASQGATWWPAQATVNAAIVALGDIDPLRVTPARGR